jgi:D-arabinose 1-dehydrogenase-like Zn-dependent alcohol dehydrogenase
VQADVYFNGVNVAFGYVLPGGMQQYVLVGEQILHGDEGCYLIGVNSDISYAEAALVEPWTCVVAAYRIHPRKHIKPGGYTLVVGNGGGSFNFIDAICADGAPRKLVLAGVSESVKSSICTCEKCSVEVIEIGKLKPEDVKPLMQERTGARGFDDIIVLGAPDADLIEALGEALAKKAVLAIVANEPMSRPVQVDVGRVHYDYIDYIGTNTGNVADAYARSRDSELIPNGAAWFIGAAGPMGQMHVLRAAKMKNGPKKMLCTDVDNARLEYLKAGG